MKTIRTTCCILATVFSMGLASAGPKELPAWHDPEVVEENRAPMTAAFVTDGLRLPLSGI